MNWSYSILQVNDTSLNAIGNQTGIINYLLKGVINQLSISVSMYVICRIFKLSDLKLQFKGLSTSAFVGPNLFPRIAFGLFPSNIVPTNFVPDSETKVGRQCRSYCPSVPGCDQYSFMELFFKQCIFVKNGN